MRNQDNCPICESVNLICLKEDHKALEYARKCCKDKRCCL